MISIISHVPQQSSCLWKVEIQQPINWLYTACAGKGSIWGKWKATGDSKKEMGWGKATQARKERQQAKIEAIGERNSKWKRQQYKQERKGSSLTITHISIAVLPYINSVYQDFILQQKRFWVHCIALNVNDISEWSQKIRWFNATT